MVSGALLKVDVCAKRPAAARSWRGRMTGRRDSEGNVHGVCRWGRGVRSERNGRGRVRSNVNEEPRMLLYMTGFNAKSLDRVRVAITTLGRGGHGDAGNFPALMVSRSLFAALNAGAREAAMWMLSPGAGLRPRRAARVRVVNLPKPAIATVSFLASTSLIVVNMAETTASVVARETAAWAATCGLPS